MPQPWFKLPSGGRITAAQCRILALLILRRHAIPSAAIKAELGMRFITARSFAHLVQLDVIRHCDRGWVATAIATDLKPEALGYTSDVYGQLVRMGSSP